MSVTLPATLAEASDEQLARILEHADPMVLRAVIHHATGQDDVESLVTTQLPGLFRPVPWIEDTASLQKLHAAALSLLQEYRDGRRTPPTIIDADKLRKTMSLAVDELVPEDELEFWIEELALDPSRRQHQWPANVDRKAISDFRVLVVGAGLGGLNAAIQLKKAGFNFSVVDKNQAVGGTWHQNRYPGARVDLPSRLYSHSIAMEYHFEHRYAPQRENERYVNWLADRFELRDHLKLGIEVTALTWDEKAGKWRAELRHADGTAEVQYANAVISAVGFLDRPSIPDIPGMDDFEGRVFHTTSFDPSLDLSDKAVAVVGTGASGMQMVPDLRPLAKHITIFQRSPGWVLPVAGYRDPYPPEAFWLQRNVPFYAHWTRFTLAWAIGDHGRYSIWSVDPEWKEPNTLSKENYELRIKLIDYMKGKIGHRPDLMKALLPAYPPLSKRYVIDNGWFEAVLSENVSLVADDPIDHVEASSIVTKSGARHSADLIIFATGFRANQYFWPMKVTGRNNRTVDEIWAKDGARAFWGISVAGLPNFFCIYGPNTNPKNTGPVPYGEMQVRYILKCLGAMIENDWKAIDVKQDVFEAHNRIVDDRNATSVFLDKRQKSYYTNEFGRSAVASPWATIEYWRSIRAPYLGDYEVTLRDEGSLTGPTGE